MIDVHILRTSESRNPIGSVAPLDMMIAIGFGSAVVTHDGKTVLDGDRALGWLRVRDAEKRAKRDPRGCWQIHIDGPLWSAVWERKRPGKWVCIEAGRGFA